MDVDNILVIMPDTISLEPGSKEQGTYGSPATPPIIKNLQIINNYVTQ